MAIGKMACSVSPREAGKSNEQQKVSKKKFVLRIDDDVYSALERWAADDFRSVNGQIEWLLAQALKKQGRWRADSEAPRPEEPADES